MADEVSQDIENALNKIVNTADQSGCMRKELKMTIFETVSTLMNLFTKIKGMVDERTRQNKELENEFNTVKACRRVTTAGHAETSSVREREPPRTIGRQVLPSQTGIGSFTPV
jgi:histidinol phosphatase-like enzyme